MSTLADNMKVVRKALNCNQTAMAQVLGTGFRTYVRYEAGERDAPASLLVKLAHLGNISLDQLLTTRLTRADIRIEKEPIDSESPPTVLSGSLEEGRILLKGHLDDWLITTNPDESNLLRQFRTLSGSDKKKCLTRLEQALAVPPSENKSSLSGKSAKKKHAARIRKIARSVKKTTLR